MTEPVLAQLAALKGLLWMGGWAPLGYDIRDRKLVIKSAEAVSVRAIFQRFARVGSMTKLIPILAKEGIRAKSGKPIDKGYLYRVINNRLYIGEAVHKGTAYPGEHEAIIERALWDRVHAVLRESPRKRAAQSRARTPALLKGIIFGPTGKAMTPTHTWRNGKLYRYYVATDVLKVGADACPLRRIPAAEIERAVMDQLRVLLRAPEIIIQTWRAARQTIPDITEAEVRSALEQLDPLWEELFPAEQARIVQLLVERVDIESDGGADISLHVDGLISLLRDLHAPLRTQEAA
jgi:site-specific DNA recombinase